MLTCGCGLDGGVQTPDLHGLGGVHSWQPACGACSTHIRVAGSSCTQLYCCSALQGLPLSATQQPLVYYNLQPAQYAGLQSRHPECTCTETVRSRGPTRGHSRGCPRAGMPCPVGVLPAGVLEENSIPFVLCLEQGPAAALAWCRGLDQPSVSGQWGGASSGCSSSSGCFSACMAAAAR